MRYIVITWGSLGDVHPYLGLAVAIKARGDDVVFLTNDAVQEIVEPTGIPFHAIGTRAEAEAILNNPDLWHPRKGFDAVWRSCIGTQRLIIDYLLAQPGIAENAVQVAEYRSGKDKVFGFFVGRAMKASGGRANPIQLNDILKKKLAP